MSGYFLTFAINVDFHHRADTYSYILHEPYGSVLMLHNFNGF